MQSRSTKRPRTRRRRDEDLAALLDPLGEARVDPLEDGLVVDAARMATERDHAERGGRHQLELRRRLDPRLRVQRQVEAAVDRLRGRRATPK